MVNERYRASIPSSGLPNTAIAVTPKEDLFLITDQWLLPWLDFVKENRQVYRAIHAQMDTFSVEHTYRVYFENVFSPILSRYGVAEKSMSTSWSFIATAWCLLC